MNISILLKTISSRLKYYYDNNTPFPETRTRIKDEYIDLNLFPEEYIGVYETIYPIAEAWDDLIESDRHTILEFLTGIRQYTDGIVLIMWIKNQTNINNHKLMEEIMIKNN